MNQTKLKEFSKTIQAFRLFDNEVQAQTVLTLLLIAQKEGRDGGYCIKDVADDLGISQASASRNVMVWSKVTRKRTPGPDLVLAKEDYNHRARKNITLTARGKKFLATLFT